MFLPGDEEEVVLVESRCWSLSLKLEDHNSIVVTRSEEVDLWMSRNHPESIILPFERLD